MDILIHKDTSCCGSGTISFEIHRNGWCDENKSTETKSEYRATVQRNGYMRKIIPLNCMIHGQSEYKFLQDLKTTKEQLFSMFSVTDDIKNNDYLIRDVDPWICFSEGLDIVLYFGEDKPVLKERTVKSNTKHRLTWTHSNKHQFDGTPATYKYWDVKDKTKLIICGIWLQYLEHTFPELEYKFDHNYWACYDNPKVPELILNEPFKAIREYDYSDEEKRVIIEKEERKREEEERKRKELEERKNTPGFCHLCGAEHAEYNPFEGVYICHKCYWDSRY